MRALIIGGSRFIGPPVLRRFVRSGVETAVFNRGLTHLPKDLCDEVKVLMGDRRSLDGEAVRQLREFAPDVVIDMIAMIESDSIQLLDAISKHTSHIVTISSMDVYANYGRLLGLEATKIDNEPMRETSPLRSTLFPYRRAEPRDSTDPKKWLDDYDKILVENAVLSQSDVRSTVLRLPMVYGPGDYQHRLFQYLKRIDDRRPFVLFTELGLKWNASRAYVDDIAGGIFNAATNESCSGVYNLAEPTAHSELEWLTMISAVCDWNGKPCVVREDEMPEHLKSTSNLQHHLVADSSRARNEIAYQEEMSEQERLRRTIEWERSNPPEFNPSEFDYDAEDKAICF